MQIEIVANDVMYQTVWLSVVLLWTYKWVLNYVQSNAGFE